jgi:AraC-like DNA-binding protein
LPAKVQAVILRLLRKKDSLLSASAMERQPISCRSIIDRAEEPFVLFHEQLGCFQSDWHAHTWGQLVYAEKGCIHLRSEGRKSLIPGGYGVWIPPDAGHQIWSDSASLHMRALCFPVGEGISGDDIAVFPVSSLLRELIRYTEKWREGGDDTVQPFLRVITTLIPEELKKATLVYLPSTGHPRLSVVLSYIQAHLAESFSFEWLAGEYGFSVRSLSRLFQAELGTSFSGYCRIARIIRALELIEGGADHVSGLAEDVGYESLPTFSNNFLEICGQRPALFIRSRKGQVDETVSD